MESDVLDGAGQTTQPGVSKWVYVAAGCGVLLLILVCLCLAMIFLAPFFMWYVDTNAIWCDVFGPLIPACP